MTTCYQPETATATPPDTSAAMMVRFSGRVVFNTLVAIPHDSSSVATTAQPFTARQIEIISLAAQGLSNKDIADRLTMSIRSVEGHLFRASQRVGANNREQLISMLRGL